MARVWSHGQLAPMAPEVRADPCSYTDINDFLLEVGAHIQTGGILLLGEVHDNPEHHKLRAHLVAATSISRLRPAVVMEQIRDDQGPILQAYLARAFASAGGIGEALEWSKSGWPDWKFFQPIAEVALAARLPILPGDAPREQIKMLARGGRVGLGEAGLALVRMGEGLPQPLVDALNEELVGSHCGAVPASAFGNMNVAQRYRDAHLARAIVSAAEKHGGAFLLAGNGHVRTDRGVPWYVRQMASDRRILAVMLVEVEDGKIDPAAYVPRAPDGAPAADYVLFTPRHDRADPCEKMRQGKKPN
jgi:uncharacterized iron-regulated protein